MGVTWLVRGGCDSRACSWLVIDTAVAVVVVGDVDAPTTAAPLNNHWVLNLVLRQSAQKEVATFKA